MTPKEHRKSLPFLVTLAGCVLMLAWVDPAHATEVSRQLSQKGYALSQLRKGDVAIVKNQHNDLKVFFKAFNAMQASELVGPEFESNNFSSEYKVVFPHFVKSSLKADILTWMKRE